MTTYSSALDRESQVSKFSFGSFAVVEATPTQSECMTVVCDIIILIERFYFLWGFNP